MQLDEVKKRDNIYPGFFFSIFVFFYYIFPDIFCAKLKIDNKKNVVINAYGSDNFKYSSFCMRNHVQSLICMYLTFF